MESNISDMLFYSTFVGKFTNGLCKHMVLSRNETETSVTAYFMSE